MKYTWASAFPLLAQSMLELIQIKSCELNAGTVFRPRYGGVLLLQTLSAHIKNCLARAEESKRSAAATADPRFKADFLRLEQSWRQLAESYQLSERLECFLLKSGTVAVGGWQPISTAPFDCELELAVIDNNESHALAFPCRRILGGWVKAEHNEKLISFQPTHWREWQDAG